MEASPSPFTVVPPRRAFRYLLMVSGLLMAVFVTLTYFVVSYNTATEGFPVGSPVVITEGSSISAIVKNLKSNNIVQSELLLYIILLTQYTPSDIKASTYVFDQPYTTFQIAEKLANGDFTSNLVRLTHREGERVSELAIAVHDALPSITVEEFTTQALPYEGKLFPETYFIPPHFTANDVVATLNEKYETFIIPRRGAIAASGLTEDEVVILASILEREANDPESMGMVSGILQNRLAIDMPLQADASIEYVLDKPLGELVPEDLELESPYNTYLNRGLPPTPIGNPGGVAIDAVLEPTPNDYLFYITGNDGLFYYAETYEDHRRNIARYLR